MQGVPMPVTHHIGTRGQMRIHILPQLVVVGRILPFGIPALCLRVGFGYQIVSSPLNRAHKVARAGNGLSVLIILHIVIDINGRVLHLLKTLHLIDILERGHKAMRDKLIGPFIGLHQIGLPVQKPGNPMPFKPLPFQFHGGVGDAVHPGELLP